MVGLTMDQLQELMEVKVDNERLRKQLAQERMKQRIKASTLKSIPDQLIVAKDHGYHSFTRVEDILSCVAVALSSAGVEIIDD